MTIRQRITLARAALILAGRVLLIIGAIVAWRAEASTALLVMGGVLVFLAFIGDWTAFRLSHGDWAAEVTRAATDELEETGSELVDVASEPDVPTQIRERLTELAEAVNASAAHLQSVSVDPPWMSSWRRVFVGERGERLVPRMSVEPRAGQVALVSTCLDRRTSTRCFAVCRRQAAAIP